MYKNKHKKKASRSNSVTSRRHNYTNQHINYKKKALKRKKRALYIIAATLCAVVILCISIIWNQLTAVSAYHDSYRENPDIAVSEESFEHAGISETVNDSNIESDDWNLVLINSSNPITEELYFTKQKLTNGIQVDQRIYQPLQDMLLDGKQENLSFVVCSGYRSIETQTTLFENKIKRLQAEGYSYHEAYETAGTMVAFPGASEHQLGLAVDIVSSAYQLLDDEQANTPEAIWLKENCYKYGFILRYPYDKQDITNIIFEPWHFRYVGIEAATEIMTTNITLEEYLAESGL